MRLLSGSKGGYYRSVNSLPSTTGGTHPFLGFYRIENLVGRKGAQLLKRFDFQRFNPGAIRLLASFKASVGSTSLKPSRSRRWPFGRVAGCGEAISVLTAKEPALSRRWSHSADRRRTCRCWLDHWSAATMSSSRSFQPNVGLFRQILCAKSRRPKPIVDGDQHHSLGGHKVAVVARLRTTSARITTAVNPEHHRQLALGVRIGGRVNVQEEAVSLVRHPERSCRRRRVLSAVRAEFVASRSPFHFARLRRLPAQIAHRARYGSP